MNTGSKRLTLRSFSASHFCKSEISGRMSLRWMGFEGLGRVRCLAFEVGFGVFAFCVGYGKECGSAVAWGCLRHCPWLR